MIEPTSNTSNHLDGDASITTFVKRLADELGDLVASIRLSGELLTKDLPDDVRKELQNIIVTESIRMENAIERSVYFTTLSVPHRHPLRIKELLELSLRASGITIPVSLDSATEVDELVVNGDRAQVVRLLNELIRNAQEAGATSLQITQRVISDKAGKDFLEICIIDDGEGFNGAEAERLIEPFFTTRHGRVGLGLAIARSIVESHGWAIEFRKGEPSGTEVVIRLSEE